MAPALLPFPITVNLRRLFPAASFVGCGTLKVQAAADHTHDVRPGSLFAAVRGSRTDGHDHIPDALARGAAALLVERPLAEVAVPQCIVPDAAKAFAELCFALQGNPAERLGAIGVTGTNGKTTTAWMVRSILQHAGLQSGLLGTIEYHDGVRSARASLTTPRSTELAHWLGEMVRQRTSHVALELSSHALDQHRAAGLGLDVAVLTNITQDHFDYHQTYDAYRAAKLKIFELLKSGGRGVLNADDPGALSGRVAAPARVTTYGLDRPADVTARILDESLNRTLFQLRHHDREVTVETRLIGRHNVSNCLAAAAACLHFDIPLTQIAAGLAALRAVPGRLEAVECGQPYNVFVDFAHTDDALRRCLATVRRLTAGKVICVFGAGGDRDRTKRPKLGRAAAAADVAIVTSDNPRSEDPHDIVQEILAGFDAHGPRPLVEVDRALAIRQAIACAEPGDSILIAGKGHETEQIIGPDRWHFDDRETARLQIHAAALAPRPHSRTRVGTR